MKNPSSASAIPAEMLEKLRAVLRHERRVRLQTGLTRACAVLLSAMLVMMAVDWLATPREAPWRWLMTLSALACGGAALLLGCLIPLFRSRSLDSVAAQVDRAHPSLQERCQTTTEFAQCQDQPEIRGSEGMIRKVAQETAAMSGTVVPAAVVSKHSLICAGKFFGAAAGVLALFFAVDFPRATVLCERFFKPGTDITLTRLQSRTGDLVIGKGENVTLEFTAAGKATDSAKLFLHPAAGREEVVVLDKDAQESTAAASKFVYTANSVMASFEYRARSGDGQTALHRVTVLERPSLAQVQFRIEAPAYSQLPVVNEKSLPRQVRALEGSKLEISFLPDQELASLVLKFSDGAIQRLEKSADHSYHFSAVLSNSLAFEPVLTSLRHLDNQSRPDCQILVYQDQPPTVNITSPSQEITARPDDKIQIEFEARDDFGLDRADLVVSVTSEDGSNSPPVTIPVPLDKKEAGSKFIRKGVELDLSQFNLKQDQELNYSVRVTDTRNDSSFSTPRPDANAPSQAQSSETASAPNQNSQPNDSQNQAQQNTAQNQAQPNAAQDQAQQNGAQSPSQQNMAQNQARQNNGQNSSRPNAAQDQSRQNGAQNPSQQDMARNQSRQNNGQNPSRPNTAQDQSQQSGAQNPSQQNMAQDQAQPNAAQDQSQQNGAQNPSQQDMAQNQARQNNGQNSSQPNTARIRSQQNGAQNQSQQNTARNPSSQQPSQSPDNQDQNQNQDQTSPATQDQNHIAMASPNSNSSSNSTPASNSSQPPPNNMSKRALDVAAGQTSSAQPMRIVVDEWADSFEGQMREKQELAIDPTLKLLDELLHKAHDLTESNLLAAQSPAGLGVEQTWALEESKEQVRQADRAVVDLKKDSAGTAYAFIGLQVSDIGDMHIAPAREELGEVTLESAQAREDRENLAQASFHLEQARKRLGDLTKNYESVKRDNKLADAMQQLKKMHQIFLEDTQAMLGSKKPPINSTQRKVAEVDDDYAAQLNDLMQEQKKIMAELAKILADDPRMLRRFMAMQEMDTTTLRDQLTLLARRQQTLAQQTAQWTAAGETERPAIASQSLIAQTAEQSEVSSLAAKMHENMITWLPEGVEQDKEPVATALALAAEGGRLASLAASQASPATLTNSLDNARLALDQFRLLHEYLPGMADDADAQNLSVFTANRLNEAADLVTKQSGWIKKMEALLDGDFPQSAAVDQHRLALDTAAFSEKLDAAVPSVAAISSEIQAKSDQLLHTVQKQVLPEETRAVDALARKTLKDAASRQEGANTAFAQAETQFDDLLHLIVAKLDSAPPPSDAGQNQTLEEMLAMLKDEKKAAEELGIPNRPLNVQIMMDWLRQASQQAGGQAQRQSRSAQSRAAQQRARDASARTARASEQAARNARNRAAALARQGVLPGNSNEGGPQAPANGWNTLASKLGDELRQSRDNVPPEQYRQAIEQYFNSISETMPTTPPASEPSAP